MDKKQVLKKYLDFLGDKIRDMEKSLASIQQGVIASPGPGQSHSDTTRFQQANVALGVDRRIGELKEKAALLQGVDLTPKDTIFVGALFTLRYEGSRENMVYFLVQKGEGDTIEIDGEEIMFVSANAPIAEAVISKKKGDRVNFRDRVLEIIEVQ